MDEGVEKIVKALESGKLDDEEMAVAADMLKAMDDKQQAHDKEMEEIAGELGQLRDMVRSATETTDDMSVAAIWCDGGKIYRRDYAGPNDEMGAFLSMLKADGYPFVVASAATVKCSSVRDGVEWLKGRAKKLLDMIDALGIPDEMLDELDAEDGRE